MTTLILAAMAGCVVSAGCLIARERRRGLIALPATATMVVSMVDELSMRLLVPSLWCLVIALVIVASAVTSRATGSGFGGLGPVGLLVSGYAMCVGFHSGAGGEVPGHHGVDGPAVAGVVVVAYLVTSVWRVCRRGDPLRRVEIASMGGSVALMAVASL